MVGNEDAENDAGEKNDEKVEKTCAYCKKRALEYIKCIKCENIFHKSCIKRVKNIKTITAEIGLCCYDDNHAQNLMFITAILMESEARKTEIELLKKINKEID